MKNTIESNCKKYAKEIIKKWEDGCTATDLAKEFHCHISYIRQLMIKTIGEESYRKGCNARTGKASPKYREKTTYPNWMTKRR